jgi:uncharacterized membrane protein YkvA (DUF1232 family)
VHAEHIHTHEEVTPLDAFFSFLKVVTIGICALIALVLVLLAIPQSRFKSTVTEFLAWCGFVGASGFVLSPLDLIPDVIPVIGWADDAGYVLLALACAYIGWKQRHRRLTTDTVIDMEPTPPFPKGKPHLWHMQETAQRGRPS